MGAWSSEPFGNDTAADWAWELDDTSDWDLVRTALSDVLADQDFIDADVATIAIAAADVVARAQARPLPDRSVPDDSAEDGPEDEADEDDESDNESVAAFLQRAGDPPADLVALAQSALDAATGPGSELADLWRESGSDEWNRSNARVRAALGG